MSYEIMTESYNFVKCYGKDEIFIEICYYNAVKSTGKQWPEYDILYADEYIDRDNRTDL